MSVQKEQVIIVDEHDIPLEIMDKVEAHKKGLLHRAFSVFIFNAKKELLLQQRAQSKYHSGGLWSNTCCSHPIPGEDTLTAAHRRLQEEMGFDCTLEHLFSFQYKADVGNGLIENEFDHVYIGMYEGDIIPAPGEVSAYQYLALDKLQSLMHSEPGNFTPWLHLAMPAVTARLNQGAQISAGQYS